MSFKVEDLQKALIAALANIAASTDNTSALGKVSDSLVVEKAVKKQPAEEAATPVFDMTGLAKAIAVELKTVFTATEKQPVNDGNELAAQIAKALGKNVGDGTQEIIVKSTPKGVSIERHGSTKFGKNTEADDDAAEGETIKTMDEMNKALSALSTEERHEAMALYFERRMTGNKTSAAFFENALAQANAIEE